MPKKKSTKPPKPLYRTPWPESMLPPVADEVGRPIATAAFALRDDGSIVSSEGRAARVPSQSGESGTRPSENAPPRLAFSDPARSLWLYHGNCLELLDAIAAKHPEGRFDCIFADPPYFLSNGGISCHAGKMVKVDKGGWDVSRGPELNHEFNTEWLKRCQKVLKPDGTLWVSGTLHVIHSIGYALQQLGFRLLNEITWEKPNPPPNLGCRCFTHSTETVLWAAKNAKSKHLFNYADMRKVTGKQMKTVWRKEEFDGRARHSVRADEGGKSPAGAQGTDAPYLDSIWTMTAPGGGEKTHGKHPTQKPVALIERCLLASTRPGDLVLDPFLGGGTTALAALRTGRGCVGIELDEMHAELCVKRLKAEANKSQPELI